MVHLDTQKDSWLYQEKKTVSNIKMILPYFSSRPFLCSEKQTLFKLMFILVFI